jgi:hypothetical protein
MKVLISSLVNHSHFSFILSSLKNLTIIPRNASIKLKNLPPSKNKNNLDNHMDSPPKTITVSGDYISIWERSFKSLETLSDNNALLSFPALNKKSKADELSDVASFVMGSLELVNISPLLQKEPQSYNQVSKLLEGLDEDDVRLIDKVKKFKNLKEENSEKFCECCGNIIKSSLLSFFVNLTRFPLINVNYVIIMFATIA